MWAEFQLGYRKTVGEKLADVEGVNQIYFTLGDTNFIVISNLPSRGTVYSSVQHLLNRRSVVKRLTRSLKVVVGDEGGEPAVQVL